MINKDVKHYNYQPSFGERHGGKLIILGFSIILFAESVVDCMGVY